MLPPQFPKEDLLEMIQIAEGKMDGRQKKLWKAIAIQPEKWGQSPYGETKGFWAVALVGRTVVWYNDIEHGFNRTEYRKYGTIDEYGCNIDELQTTVRYLLYELDENYRFGLE